MFGAKSRHYFKSLKRYVSNRRWFTMYLFGRFRSVQRVATFFAEPARDYSKQRTFFPGVHVDEVVRQMRLNGYCEGLQLPEEVVDEVLRFSEANRCFDDQSPNTWFRYSDHKKTEMQNGRSILIGRYANTANGCPAIAALQNDSTLLQIAAGYLKRHPIHVGNRLWWSFATNVNEAHARVRSGQAFHYDLDDYRTVTFFFYLTDVDKLGGPHTIVRGSHANKKLRYVFSLFKTRDESELRSYYGDESFIELCGPAGSGFVEDLQCYHRGNPPVEKDRLILQIRYALNDYDNANDLRSDLPSE